MISEFIKANCFEVQLIFIVGDVYMAVKCRSRDGAKFQLYYYMSYDCYNQNKHPSYVEPS